MSSPNSRGEGRWGYGLDTFKNHIEKNPEERVLLKDLPVGAIVEFQTQNSTYRFQVTNPKKYEGLITGGRYGNTPTAVTINGSKADQGVSMIFSGAVMNGLIIEIGDPAVVPYLETSRVKAVFVERP